MKGRMISPGKAEGKAIVSTEPIGFYGGIDIKTKAGLQNSSDFRRFLEVLKLKDLKDWDGTVFE